jgi:phosphate/sulfate permease
MSETWEAYATLVPWMGEVGHSSLGLWTGLFIHGPEVCKTLGEPMGAQSYANAEYTANKSAILECETSSY